MTQGAARGLALFARYAYPPNERGYCGPADHRDLLAHLDGVPPAGPAADRLAELARRFTGPLPYLRTLAEAAGIPDPFELEVVRAYWIGSDLLDAVDSRRFGTALAAAFAGAPTVDPRRIAMTTPGGVPNHSYHVLVTYPWIDLIAAGRHDAVSILDQCRIRWGTVEGIQGDAVTVRSRPLIVVDGRLALGEARSEGVVRALPGAGSPDGTGEPLSVGDVVALHWQWVCDRLTHADVTALQRVSTDQIALVNDRLLSAPPSLHEMRR